MAQQDSASFLDPKLDNSEGDPEAGKAGEEQPKGEGTSKEVDGEGKEGSGEPDFGGLPFKDVQSFVKAHKELQAHSTRTSQELAELRGLLKEIIPLLPKAEQREAKQDLKEDPETFIKKFVENPNSVLGDLINKALESQLSKTVQPLEGRLTAAEATVELKDFLGEHPEFTEDDVDDFIKVIDAYPEVRPRRDRMEVWFTLFKNSNPEIGARMAEKKKELERGASDAKLAAGQGGKKSSTPKSSTKDDFDELLDLYAERNKYFRK